MSFVSVLINGVDITEESSAAGNDPSLSPFSYLKGAPTAFFRSNVPFALTSITYSHEDDNPFRMMLVSPAYTMFAVLSAEEFRSLVPGRPMHQHDNYELIYVLEGELYQRIDRSRHLFPKNSCCLINRNVRHAEEYLSDFHTLYCSFSQEFLQNLYQEGRKDFFHSDAPAPTIFADFINRELTDVFMADKQYLDFSPKDPAAVYSPDIHSILDRITTEVLSPTPASSLMIKALFYQILCQLNDPEFYVPSMIRLGTTAENQLFSEINQRMEQTHGRISRSQLAEELHYSGTYINQIIQKFTGCSTFEYGNHFTMKQAAYLLLHTDLTTTQIIEELGFSDRTHFYRLFQKEFQMTPAKYRKHYRE